MPAKKRYYERIYIFLLISVICSSCLFQNGETTFRFKKSNQGVQLLENGKPVFFYQKEPKSLTGKYVSNNYLHPLYNLEGDTITEEFPADHPYHRGIFWAWHQIYIQDKTVGDGWTLDNIDQKVVNVKTILKDSAAQVELDVLWKSSLYQNGKSFVQEKTTVIVYPLENNIRKIDFVIALKALVPGVKIGGSDDVKGYGGFCARLKLPDDLVFTSVQGDVKPTVEQIEAGPWMDFSASFGEKKGEITGISILCHPETPNYPAPWIIRSKTSMQNIVFPGQDPVELPLDEPLVLFYRLIVHNGKADNINMDRLQSEYEQTAVENL